MTLNQLRKSKIVKLLPSCFGYRFKTANVEGVLIAIPPSLKTA
jgi:hypothetical protein